MKNLQETIQRQTKDLTAKEEEMNKMAAAFQTEHEKRAEALRKSQEELEEIKEQNELLKDAVRTNTAKIKRRKT